VVNTITRGIPRHDDDTKFFESSGQRVRYRVRGEGPPLLMVHGIGASLEWWGPLEEELGDFQTITVDPPGAGRSSTPRGPFGMRQIASVMADLVAHLDVGPVSVLGLSLGGMIGQELAYRSPHLVERLVLASTSCGVGGVPANPKTLAMIASPGRFYSRGQYRQFAPLVYGDAILDDPALLEEHIEIRQRCKPSVMGYFIQFGAVCTWSSLPWLHKLNLPVLVIAGTEDRCVPFSNARRLAGAIPGARLEVFEGGSHMCLLQESTTTAPMIRDFLLEA
jgi:pimeloyl-ACP methyl ester carboxylesterase